MEVKVIKFERHLEEQKVSVTFAIKKTDTGFATTMGRLVDMVGTDDEMVQKTWENIQTELKYWLTTEKNVIGKTFTVPLPDLSTVTQNTQTVDVPVTEPVTEETPLSSGN